MVLYAIVVVCFGAYHANSFPKDDDFGSPRRQSADNTTLPDPRELNNNLLSNSNNEEDLSKNHTLFFNLWWQFLEDDIAFTPLSTPRKQRRQQMNAITSFIDASNVYGSLEEELKNLRDTGGDERATEVVTLTALHQLFVKEHNRLAGKLKKFYSHTEKETVFQETRKIVGAIMQKITYDEFLPCLLSPKIRKKKMLETTYDYTYDDTINPTIMNAFAIVFRILEELETFLIDNIIIYGSHDRGARKIQRERDHGLPSYHKFRKACKLKGLKRKWGKGASGLVDHSIVLRDKLQKAYDFPRDIDVFVGGLTETPVKNGIVGPTFECIIAEQFRRLKYGDRFFFQNKDANGFKDAQIEAIQNYSLPKILCNNYSFKKINYPNVFKLCDRTECSEIADLDLEVFRPKTEQ